MKQCTKCKTVYDDVESNFYRNGKGFRSHCKICIIKKRKEHYQENRDARLENHKKHYQDNRNDILEQKKEYNKEYYQTPKGKAVNRASSAKRRALKLQQTPDYANLNLIKMIYEHCPEGYDVDHIQPLAKSGLHHESNLCYLPSNINYQKQTKSIEEFGVDKFNKHVVYWQDVLSCRH